MINFKEFPLGGENGLFDIKTTKKKFNANTVKFGGKYPYVIRSSMNNGIRGYITEDIKYLNDANTISFGQDTATMFYQKSPYFTGDKIKVFSYKHRQLDRRLAVYLITCMRKAFSSFSWGSSSFDVKILNNVKIYLPVNTNNDIDYNYIEERISELEEERISELESYLKVTGFDNFQLTEDDRTVLMCKPNYGSFEIKDLFTHIQQGARLKKNDQIDGNLPFVMSGTTNTGIVKYIGNNEVRKFPKNSITIDIFGNVFYRNYNFGAGDDTGVYWNEYKNFSREVMLYFCAAIKVVLQGKYSFGKKLRSSQSYNIKIQLPITDSNAPDFVYMENYIKAQQKLVIENVVLWKDKQINSTKIVVKN